MTVIDSSVLIAIVFGEPDAAELARQLAEVQRPIMSVVNLVEAAVVADSNPNKRKGPFLDELVADLEIEFTPVDLQQAMEARVAYGKFGKGNHPAKLNLGDCFAYGLARSRDLPLLFKGDDFSLTDIQRAAP